MPTTPARQAPALRVRLRRWLLPLFVAAGAAIGLSCSETEQPLEWSDAVRGGLGEPRSIVSQPAVEQAASDTVPVTTGPATRWLVGRFVRHGTTYQARSFLRWNVDSVPAGTITSAKISLILAAVDVGDTLQSGPFDIRLYRVEGTWSEDSLVYQPLPPVAVGAPIADAEIDTTGLGETDGILVRANLFEDDPDLIDLVTHWRDQPETNFGVMLRASSISPSGVIRFFSRTALHPTTSAVLATPLLEVTVEGADSSTVSMEAVADAYVVGPETPPEPLPDSVLVLSSGYVQRTAFRVDPLQLLGVESLPERPSEALLRAVLRLHVAHDDEWSLPAGTSVSIRAYEVEMEWTAANAPAHATLLDNLGEFAVGGGDSTVELSIASYVRHRIEGMDRSILFLATPEVSQIASVAFVGPGARIGRPEVEAAFGPLGGRWGR